MKRVLFMALFVMFSFSVMAAQVTTADVKDKKFSLVDNEKITIGFVAGNRVFGFGGVNRFMGSYTIKDGNITFGELAGTMMSGPEERMQKEAEFMQKLQSQTLPISYKDGKLVIGDLTFNEMTK